MNIDNISVVISAWLMYNIVTLIQPFQSRLALHLNYLTEIANGDVPWSPVLLQPF